jgi:hypothetical protein
MIQNSNSTTGTNNSMQNFSFLTLQRVMYTAFICIALLHYSPHSIAWGPDGHTAIGILAVAQVQPDALRELQDIVNPLSKQAMEAACNWPDVIRETEDGEWSSPLHYINIPRGETDYSGARDCPEKPEHAGRPTQYCATEAIKYFADELGNQAASKEKRWQAFAWLCHLAGDLHQPLHAGFADDRGGNDVEVVFNDEQMNLHHFWDSTLIHQQAGSWQYLVGELGEFPPVKAASNWSPDRVNDWTSESHQLAKTSAYPDNEHINACFADQTWGIIQQQIPLAASRLALIINSKLQAADKP